MVSEHKTGYIAGFSVYTGKVANELVAENAVSSDECTTTTKTVMGLLNRTSLLDNYRSVYFDNWFNSPQLLDEMYERKTLGAGTTRLNRRGLPKAVVQKKLKKGETVYRREGKLLCLKWCDKHPVTMLFSIHNAVQRQVKTNYLGNPVIKPVIVDDCNRKMNSVDHSDHMLSYYETLKSVKWYRKLILHLINMVVLNAFILNKKYGTVKMSHTSYREYLANYLITTSLDKANCLKKKPPTPIDNTETRLSGKHFIKKFDRLPNSKRKAPAQRCKVCNFTPEQLAHYGYEQLKLLVKYSSFGCTVCANVTLCLTPCFEVFHTEVNYRKKGLDIRIKEII